MSTEGADPVPDADEGADLHPQAADTETISEGPEVHRTLPPLDPPAEFVPADPTTAVRALSTVVRNFESNAPGLANAMYRKRGHTAPRTTVPNDGAGALYEAQQAVDEAAAQATQTQVYAQDLQNMEDEVTFERKQHNKRGFDEREAPQEGHVARERARIEARAAETVRLTPNPGWTPANVVSNASGITHEGIVQAVSDRELQVAIPSAYPIPPDRRSINMQKFTSITWRLHRKNGDTGTAIKLYPGQLKRSYQKSRPHCAARILELDLPVDPSNTKFTKMLPAWAHEDLAVTMWQWYYNLCIMGRCGSGKTILAWFLCISQHYRPTAQRVELAALQGTQKHKTESLSQADLGTDQSWQRMVKEPVRAVVVQIKKAAQNMNCEYARKIIPREWMNKEISAEALSVMLQLSGMRTSHERGHLPDHSLMFTTAGVMINLLRSPAFLPNTVVFDEVHERGMAMDFIIDEIIMRCINRILNKKDPIRIILASATAAKYVLSFINKEYKLDTWQPRAAHKMRNLGNTIGISDPADPRMQQGEGVLKFQCVNIEDTPYAVKHHYTNTVYRFNRIDAGVIEVMRDEQFKWILGSIVVVFTPGASEGERVASAIRKAVIPGGTDHIARINNLEMKHNEENGRGKVNQVYKLQYMDEYDFVWNNSMGPRDRGMQCVKEEMEVEVTYIDAKYSAAYQNMAFTADPKLVKVVVCTNFMESSGTVPKCRHVIICGWEKTTAYDANTGVFKAYHRRISEDSETQQGGRAGREMDGDVWHLYTKKVIQKERRSIMDNTNAYMPRNILKVGINHPRRCIPHFRNVVANRAEDISEDDALTCVRMMSKSGHNLMSLYRADHVAMALVELKFCQAIDQEGIITTLGMVMADSRMELKYAWMFNSPEILSHGGISKPAENYIWILIGLMCVAESGRSPVMTYEALCKIDQKSGTDGTQRSHGSKQHKGEFHDMSKADMAIEKRRRFDRNLRGPRIPEHYGELMQGFFLIHYVVHWILFPERGNGRFVNVPNKEYIAKIERGERPPLKAGWHDCPRENKVKFTHEIFATDYVPNLDSTLCRECDIMGLHLKSTCQIIEIMQHLTRTQGIDWRYLPNMFDQGGNNDHQYRPQPCKQDPYQEYRFSDYHLRGSIAQAMVVVAQYSFMNIGYVTTEDWDGGRMAYTLYNALDEEIFYPEKDQKKYDELLPKEEFIIWSEARDSYYDGTLIKCIDPIPFWDHPDVWVGNNRESGRDYARRVLWDKLSSLKKLGNALRDASLYMETPGSNIQKLPPVDFSIVHQEKNKFVFDDFPMLNETEVQAQIEGCMDRDDPDLQVHTVVRLNYTMALDGYWVNVQEEIPPKPEKATVTRHADDLDKLEGGSENRRCIEEYWIECKTRFPDVGVPYFTPSAQGLTWFWFCSNCRSVSKTYPGKCPKFHVCKENHRILSTAREFGSTQEFVTIPGTDTVIPSFLYMGEYADGDESMPESDHGGIIYDDDQDSDISDPTPFEYPAEQFDEHAEPSHQDTRNRLRDGRLYYRQPTIADEMSYFRSETVKARLVMVDGLTLRAFMIRHKSRGVYLYTFPGGTVKPGESTYACALREYSEESGQQFVSGNLDETEPALLDHEGIMKFPNYMGNVEVPSRRGTTEIWHVICVSHAEWTYSAERAYNYRCAEDQVKVRGYDWFFLGDESVGPMFHNMYTGLSALRKRFSGLFAPFRAELGANLWNSRSAAAWSDQQARIEISTRKHIAWNRTQRGLLEYAAYHWGYITMQNMLYAIWNECEEIAMLVNPPLDDDHVVQLYEAYRRAHLCHTYVYARVPDFSSFNPREGIRAFWTHRMRMCRDFRMSEFDVTCGAVYPDEMYSIEAMMHSFIVLQDVMRKEIVGRVETFLFERHMFWNPAYNENGCFNVQEAFFESNPNQEMLFPGDPIKSLQRSWARLQQLTYNKDGGLTSDFHPYQPEEAKYQIQSTFLNNDGEPMAEWW